MGRAPCCDKANVKRGPWSPEEDAKLKDYIHKHGTGGNWIALPQKAGLRRCGKSCRLRWLNYLRPNIKHGEFSDDEDRIICTLFANIGSRWSIIAAQLPGRTDNDIKNYWNTKLKKKILMGSSPSLLLPSNYPYTNSSQYHKTNNTYSSPSISFLQSPSSSSSSSSSSLAFKCPSNTSSTYNYSALVNSSTPPCRFSTFTAGHNCETMPNNTSIFSSSSTSPNQLILNNLQTQDASFVGPAQSLSSLIMFGLGAAAVVSGSWRTNSSDGSNKLDQVDDTQYHDHQQFMLFSNGASENINIADQDHKQMFNGVFNGATAQTPLDHYSTNRALEEIKQLISSSNHHVSSCISNANNLNFFVDDNKTTEEEEKVIMYY